MKVNLRNKSVEENNSRSFNPKMKRLKIKAMKLLVTNLIEDVVTSNKVQQDQKKILQKPKSGPRKGKNNIEMAISHNLILCFLKKPTLHI